MLKPVVLVVLDGWGLSTSVRGNAIRQAHLPTFDTLNKRYPMAVLQASGISVGLPWNTPGNSEVGHMTMGAGRIIYQNLPRITLAIEDGSFFKNEALLQAVHSAKEKRTRLHLMGLVGSGSVHSQIDHLHALVKLAKQEGLHEVYIHAFSDGRDSPPTAGIDALSALSKELQEIGVGTIASVSGRYFAMDRNQNWDRLKECYTMLTAGSPGSSSNIEQYMMQAYHDGFTDEFIVPTNICQDAGQKILIQNDDSVIFFNFREDRARELAHAFVDEHFEGFPRERLRLTFVTLTEYEQGLDALVAFPPTMAKNTLGEVLSSRGKQQLRIAETEKYAHVTYFFNGGQETAFPGEERKLVPSQNVEHFDEAPEMSAPQITEVVIQAVESRKYDFILVNYANPDMVGHTGNEEATIKAVEATDKCLSQVLPAILKAGGCAIITADHGNAEEMKKLISNETDTEHSQNPIPLWYVTPTNHRDKTADQLTREQTQVNGLLSDVAPTVLDIMQLPEPEEMNGTSLLSVLK